ncbi:MAG: hypothetical protein IKS99_03685 [Firmicutes bacterium]|nr:hypothetical protein [Bacillota bacterium]
MAKSPKRKEYLQDYKQGADGRYAYSGKNYSFDGTDSERKKAYRNLVILAVLLLASIVCSGLNNAPCAIKAYYVIIPLVGEVCAFFALARNLSKILIEGADIRGYIFETANNRIPPAALILMFFAIFGILAAGLYLLGHGFEGQMTKSLLYLLSKACNALLAFCFKNYYNSLGWKVI